MPLDAISPGAWTVIARRPLNGGCFELPPWAELPDAPVTVAEAHQLHDAGLLVMANRRTLQGVELVVRNPRAKPSAAPWEAREPKGASFFRHL